MRGFHFGVAILSMGVSFGAVRADIITQYNFGVLGQETTNEASSAFLPTIVAANVITTGVADPKNAVGLEISSAATTPASAPYLRVTTDSTTAAAALAANRYFEFSAQADAGYTLSLDSLTFNVTRGGSSGPRGYFVRSSLDNYLTDLAGSVLSTTRPTFTPISIDLSSFADLESPTPVTFRVYSYAPATGSSVDYDDFVLNGTVTSSAAIPEPSSMILAAAGAAGFAFVRRRRQNKIAGSVA